MGIARYLEAQLDPERIPDTAATRYLRTLEVLRRSPDEVGREVRAALAARRARQLQAGPDSTMPPPAEPNRSVLRRYPAELQQAAVARAVLSDRQLYEVLADFWVNHFNVFMAKGNELGLMAAYVEETIRPRVLGKFEDLLIATARSPAMLVYLDNAQSVADGAVPPGLRRLQGRGAGGQNPRRDSLRQRLEQRMPRGINENYARELLELHTLGVDGGYTQQDVGEVARILTGWSIARRDDPRFEFHQWAHDRGDKTALGRTFHPDGVNEGLALLRLLAHHPSTMRHVSGKLCMRLVSDLPAEGCIDAGVQAWQRSDGHIREVVRAILQSPEFWAPEARAAKLKTPLEFVASAVRAVGGQPDSTAALAALVGRLGQPLYLQPAPTGYPEREESWVNAGAMLERFNVAVGLAAGRLPGVQYDPDRLIPLSTDRARLPDEVDRLILLGAAGDSTLATIRRQLADLRDPTAARAFAIGLALGSPEFQRQ
jgi:uncharacterized protein (DUF1800 family)